MTTERPAQPTDLDVPMPILLDNLGGRDKMLREDAERRLLVMGERVLPSLLAALQAETERWRVRRRLASALYLPVHWTLISFWIILFAYSVGALNNSDPSFIGLFFCGWLLAGVGKTCKQVYKQESGVSRQHQRLVRLLAKMGEGRLELLGSLLDALDYTEGKTQAAIKDVVTGLLWKVKFSDAALLGEKTRRLLAARIRSNDTQRRAVRKGKPDDHLLALLQALSQIGDRSAVPAVERLRDLAVNQHLRDAAETCLLYLTDSVERRRQEQTLLRPVETVARPDELLRASIGTEETPPEQLLRASEGNRG